MLHCLLEHLVIHHIKLDLLSVIFKQHLNHGNYLLFILIRIQRSFGQAHVEYRPFLEPYAGQFHD